MKITNCTFTTVMTGMLTSVDAEKMRDKAENSRAPQQPTSIRFRPHVKSVLDELSEQLGVSASELNNIMLEGLFRSTFFALENNATSVYERFQFLMDAHGLGAMDIAQLLSQWNMKLSILENRTRTMDYLTKELLETVAGWFRVSPYWLKCNSQCLWSHCYGDYLRWSEQVGLVEMCRHFVTGKKPAVFRDGEKYQEADKDEERLNDIIFWCAPYKKLDDIHECGILVREKKKVNGIEFEPVFSYTSLLYYCKNDIAELMNFCRHASERNMLTWKAVTLSSQHAKFLMRGQLLPVALLDAVRQENEWDVSMLMNEYDNREKKEEWDWDLVTLNK